MKNAHGRLLLIRADGGPAIGFGHVMRSMAVAEEWLARGGRCVWATPQPRALDAAGSGRDDMKIVTIDAEAGGAGDAAATRKLAEECEADWVMADLYNYSPAYFSSAGARRVNWLIVSDEPLRVSERINAILTPGPQATPEYFSGRDAKCALLQGLDYILLRSELRANGMRRIDRKNPPRQVLITFGGSDPDDLTGRTLQTLWKGVPDSDIRWRVILGPGYRGQCPGDGSAFGNLSVEFVRYTSDMGRHYAWADLIICGSSTTLWEALYFGVPAIAIPAAANQRGVYEALATCGAVKRFDAPGPELAQWISSLKRGEAVAVKWMNDAAGAGPQMVDGKGVERVVDYLLARK